ncbi:MAG: hypothetical protein GC179_27100 [Anaerolineaceae bacterium]|nr:hypothetical protein [Anaerolineaceae bacterium]
MSEKTPIGKTKGQGWEIGVRKTFPVGTGRLWDALTTQPGLGYWLGTGVDADFKKGDIYETQEGTTGDIRSFEAGSLIRLTWQPKDMDSPSTLQLRVLPTKTGSTLSIHHEKLKDGEQREAMRQYWQMVISQFERLLDI